MLELEEDDVVLVLLEVSVVELVAGLEVEVVEGEGDGSA